jgi:hypothetical protein
VCRGFFGLEAVITTDSKAEQTRQKSLLATREIPFISFGLLVINEA